MAPHWSKYKYPETIPDGATYYLIKRGDISANVDVRPGDVLIAISTSGESPNVLRAVEAAHTGGLHTIALTGDAGRLAEGQCERAHDNRRITGSR